MANLLKVLCLVSALPLSLPLVSNAHMELSWPIPINSKFDPTYYNNVDYTMVAPLVGQAQYPCKGYHLSPQTKNQATYAPGQEYNITIVGGAPHDGGSCQISLSYDNGQTFKVLKSIIGGCPIKTTYDFKIPSDAPSSDTALLAWTWFNVVGNREMYMNCAHVSIQGAPAQRFRRDISKRASSLDSLPDIMTCNLDSSCTTIERRLAAYPNPGQDVEHGQDAITNDPGPFYTTSNVAAASTSAASSNAGPASASSQTPAAFYTTGNPASATSSAATPYVNSSTSTANVIIPVTTGPASSFATVTRSSATVSSPAATTVVATTSSAPAPSKAAATNSSAPAASSTGAATVSGSCTLGAIVCNTATTWSMCAPAVGGSTSLISMGSVAAGMECRDGAMVRAGSSLCSPVGALVCKGTSAFSTCTNGGLVDMGPVATGTVCRNGAIVAA